MNLIKLGDGVQIVVELEVEHGLMVENLLDLAHAPFTHTGTFAKGWPVPR
jgi:chlorophyllide a oxygenase